MSADEFFAQCPVPSSLSSVESQVLAFIKQRIQKKERCALVTSGGTTVPLEKNTVRFIDNFSTGLRGAASAEYFLANGYSVLFLSRRGSSFPYARHFQSLYSPHFDKQFLDHVHVDTNITLDYSDKIKDAVSQYDCIKKENRLLSIEFSGIEEYMYLLRACCLALNELHENAVIYSAAAVSDYFIPSSIQSIHKIQSSTGPMELTLPQTPKLLGEISRKWCSRALIVSFKLETDVEILLKKAYAAIDKYAVHAVVANELHSRHNQVILVTKHSTTTIQRESDGTELEGTLIRQIINMHNQHIKV